MEDLRHGWDVLVGRPKRFIGSSWLVFCTYGTTRMHVKNIFVYLSIIIVISCKQQSSRFSNASGNSISPIIAKCDYTRGYFHTYNIYSDVIISKEDFVFKGENEKMPSLPLTKGDSMFLYFS